jgi:peptide/nickel transport system permease protein
MSYTPEKTAQRSRLRVFLDSDIYYAFRRSPMAVVSTIVVSILILAAIFAPLIAPTNPFNPATLNLMNGFTGPSRVKAFGWAQMIKVVMSFPQSFMGCGCLCL